MSESPSFEHNIAAAEDPTEFDLDMNVPPLNQVEMNSLSLWQRQQVDGLPAIGQRCLYDSWFQTDLPAGSYCNATWDGFKCWPVAAANTTIIHQCPLIGEQMTNNWTSAVGQIAAVAHRTCDSTARWQDRTNYTLCVLNYLRVHNMTMDQQYGDTASTSGDQDHLDELSAAILRDIYFIGSIISLIVLLAAFFIFSYFKSLHCDRITIHKHLIGSFVIRSFIIFITFEPFVTGRNISYRSIEWLCKTLSALTNYTVIANTAWMFVEGLFLYRRVAVSVFNSGEHFYIYYIIGWGLPVPFIIAWTVSMHLFNMNECWKGILLITCPVLALLAINLLFLINIVRIVIAKLKADNAVELDNRIRMAIRATVILFPLLGMTNTLFCIEPRYDAMFRLIYRVTNAILQSSQGIFVSVIYCFLNAEVQAAISRKWSRFVQRRKRKSATAKAAPIQCSSDMRPCSSAVKDTAEGTTWIQHGPAD